MADKVARAVRLNDEAKALPFASPERKCVQVLGKAKAPVWWYGPVRGTTKARA